jgi:hypothetical protein
VLATYTSRLYEAVRVEIAEDELVEEDEDPDLQYSLDKAVDELAPNVASTLEQLFAGTLAAN